MCEQKKQNTYKLNFYDAYIRGKRNSTEARIQPANVPKPYAARESAQHTKHGRCITHMPQIMCHHLVPYGPSSLWGHPQRFQVLNHDVRVEVRRGRHGTRGTRHGGAGLSSPPNSSATTVEIQEEAAKQY